MAVTVIEGLHPDHFVPIQLGLALIDLSGVQVDGIWSDIAITIVNQDKRGNIAIFNLPAGGSLPFGLYHILSGSQTETAVTPITGSTLSSPRSASTTTCVVNIAMTGK